MNENKFSAGFLAERKFFLEELDQYMAVVALQTPVGILGIQVYQAGQTGYIESGLGIGYAKKLGLVDLGLKFNHHTIKIPGYGSAAAIIAELGTLWHVSEKVQTGFHIYNPFSMSIGRTYGEKFSYSYAAGVGYEVSKQVYIGIEVRKEENKTININTGFHYRFAKQFFARAGLATESSQPYLTAGWKWKAIRIDATAAYHPQLGVSPGLLLIYQPPKKDTASISE